MGRLLNWFGRTPATTIRGHRALGAGIPAMPQRSNGLFRRGTRATGRGVGSSLLIGGAVTAGAISGFMEPEGSWRSSIFPTTQSALFDDPNAIQNLAIGGAGDAFSSDPSKEIKRGNLFNDADDPAIGSILGLATVNNNYSKGYSGLPTNYYYGEPISSKTYQRTSGQSIGSSHPVTGNVVFGMWNMRR